MFIRLAVFACFSFAIPAQAWGPEGHEIVAAVALREMTPAAKAKVAALLGSDTMMVHEASWADEIRDHSPQTGPWHYVDIPLAASGYDAARDCPSDNCVVAQIDIARRTLGDTHTDRDKRRDALRFLIHFVADVHQPLHAEDNHDHGGNQLIVQFGADHTNLHRIWDTQVVKALGNGEEDIAIELDRNVTAAQRKDWERGTIADWANQAHAIARDVIYPVMGDNNHVRMPLNYAHLAEPLTRLQLSRAGVRLAWVLNNTLK